MKDQFDVWRFNFPDKGEHPVVLISHPDRCARAVVNVLFCTSQRQSRPPNPYEVALNGADGMDWETFCDCSILYSVPAAGLFGKRAEFHWNDGAQSAPNSEMCFGCPPPTN